MIYAQSLGRAAQFSPARPALVSATGRLTFTQLHERVARTAAALKAGGFSAGDRLALLLPISTRYLEILYACAWLGVVAVPLNTRFSQQEIDLVLADARPRGMIRHASLPTPSATLGWQEVLDERPLDLSDETCSKPLHDPEAVLAILYARSTTDRPMGVALTHAATFANISHINRGMPYAAGGVYLHATPLLDIADFPFLFAAPAFGACQIIAPEFDPWMFCETVQREQVTCTVLAPEMIKLLLQFPQRNRYDLTSVKQLGYGGSPIAREVLNQTRAVFPRLTLLQTYGLSESGFLTTIQDEEHLLLKRAKYTRAAWIAAPDQYASVGGLLRHG